jgi:hypothetical protein
MDGIKKCMSCEKREMAAMYGMASVCLMTAYAFYEYGQEIKLSYRICYQKTKSYPQATILFLYYIGFMVWTLIEQSFHHRVRKVTKSRIEVDYVYHGSVYTLQLPVPHGPFYENTIFKVARYVSGDHVVCQLICRSGICFRDG